MKRSHIGAPTIKLGSASPAPKLPTMVGMYAGADRIDDIGVVRSGGMKALLTVCMHARRFGMLLREFIFGHARQPESVVRELLVALCGQAELLPGADNRLFVDIDSLRDLGMP